MDFATLRRLITARCTSLLLSALLTATAGCAVMPACLTCGKPAKVEPAPVNHVLTYWDNRIRETPDSVNQGATLKGLAGRVYLFSDESKAAVDANGKVVVELYDVTHTGAGGQPQKLSDWTFDAPVLKQLKRPDRIGEGYTLFLPWENSRPDIKQVKLQMAYIPQNGPPHYADPTVMTLRADEPLTIQNQQINPTQYQTMQRR